MDRLLLSLAFFFRSQFSLPEHNLPHPLRHLLISTIDICNFRKYHLERLLNVVGPFAWLHSIREAIPGIFVLREQEFRLQSIPDLNTVPAFLKLSSQKTTEIPRLGLLDTQEGYTSCVDQHRDSPSSAHRLWTSKY